MSCREEGRAGDGTSAQVARNRPISAEVKMACGHARACVHAIPQKPHAEVPERTINTIRLPARWATSSQVGVVSIAVNAIYLMYWPITTSPLWAPAEGSPAVSQHGHRRTIDWGVVLFLQADPHSCACLLLCFHPAPSLSAYFSVCAPLPLPLYLSRLSLCSPRTGCRLPCRATLAKINSIILIQTDIKRQRASRQFLCRLIISLCFWFGPFQRLFSGALWVSLTQHV